MRVHFIKGQMGKDILVYNGNVYWTDHKTNNKTWMCTELKCKRRLHTEDDRVTKTTAHFHVPDPAKVDVRSTINNIKDRVIVTTAAPQQIIAKITAQVASAADGRLLSISSKKHD